MSEEAIENEIQENGWLHCPADADLVFGADAEEKYGRALRKIGMQAWVTM